MKKKISLTIMVMLLIVACQKDDDIEAVTTKEVQTQTRGLSIPNSPTYEDLLQNQLQWISYLTAQVLLNDTSGAEEQFVAVLSAPGNSGDISQTIDLLDLLDQPGSPFYQEFRAQFTRFTGGCGGDDGQGTETFNCGGGNGPQPVPAPGSTGSCDDFCQFLTAILHFNCIELYLPNGYDKYEEIIVSSAHPLDNGNLNEEAYRHINIEQVLDTYVSNLNVNHLSNPIIARPYRERFSCDYDMLDVLDFEAFLDY